MNAAALARNNAVEVRKVAYRQSKDGMVISFVLHPADAPEDLVTAPIGTRYMLAAVRIGDDEQPQAPEPQQKQGKRRWHEMPASQRAAILCKDETFIDWLIEWLVARPALNIPTWNGEDATQWAADALRSYCGVHSRAHLDTNEGARRKFERLEEDFQIAAGRVPPPDR